MYNNIDLGPVAQTLPTALLETKFALRVLRRLSSVDSSQNIFFSPLGLLMTLSILYNGAHGHTRDSLSKVLHDSTITIDKYNERNRENIVNLNGQTGCEFSIATALWLMYGVNFRDEFVNVCVEKYMASLFQADFRNPQSVRCINEWVANATKGRINSILQSLSEDTRMVVTNAVYFKGKWKKQFPFKLTKNEHFHLPDGRTKEIAMMQTEGEFWHRTGDGFQAVRLDYLNSSTSMFVYLPDSSVDLFSFVNWLDAEAFKMVNFTKREGVVRIPRFEVDFEARLNTVLQKLELEDLFKPGRANFARLCTRPDYIYVSEFRHKANLRVDEEGTVAAAATAAAASWGKAPSAKEKFRFTADRPFIVAIKDNTMEQILFLGVITNPGILSALESGAEAEQEQPLA